MLELCARLSLVGKESDAGYACPLTRYLLAHTLGLSDIHVNRALRKLRKAVKLTFCDGFAAFDDYDRTCECV